MLETYFTEVWDWFDGEDQSSIFLERFLVDICYPNIVTINHMLFHGLFEKPNVFQVDNLDSQSEKMASNWDIEALFDVNLSLKLVEFS